MPSEWSDPATAYDTTKSAVQRALKQLGLDYVDLMLLHAPGKSEGRADAWRALEDAHKQVMPDALVLLLADNLRDITCGTPWAQSLSSWRCVCEPEPGHPAVVHAVTGTRHR